MTEEEERILRFDATVPLEELREDFKRAWDALNHAVQLADEGWQFTSLDTAERHMVPSRLASLQAILDDTRGHLENSDA